jgi:hypothetical protein
VRAPLISVSQKGCLWCRVMTSRGGRFTAAKPRTTALIPTRLRRCCVAVDQEYTSQSWPSQIAAINCSLRLPNDCMHCKVAFADSLTRFGCWILPALVTLRFLAMSASQSCSKHLDSHGIRPHLPLRGMRTRGRRSGHGQWSTANSDTWGCPERSAPALRASCSIGCESCGSGHGVSPDGGPGDTPDT